VREPVIDLIFIKIRSGGRFGFTRSLFEFWTSELVGKSWVDLLILRGLVLLGRKGLLEPLKFLFFWV
jgi:uncharacterized membrane protein YfhO